ncbi:hypothetical protein PSQ90_05240 [Devosia rhodophyticola]|uniref:MarR family transcriptional regulator n=1 Tax=Devosia rhodophyticola TaxID=3026423 RepID=A0ABY7Z017_9HYPH|nr:hypothetical protein [Devosia rhodophyticola]WDR06856.1 hypothetical protein PSQ90_05240 [Devosia rhodophyticola]
MNQAPTPIPEDHFIEQMGLISQGEGGTRIAGRILGLLIVEGRALSLQEMAGRLQISKASASTNSRNLANREIIRMATSASSRQDYYEFVPGSYTQMVAAIGLTMRRTAAKVSESVARLEAGSARDRVQELADFYQVSAEFVDDWAERLASRSKSV